MSGLVERKGGPRRELSPTEWRALVCAVFVAAFVGLAGILSVLLAPVMGDVLSDGLAPHVIVPREADASVVANVVLCLAGVVTGTVAAERPSWVLILACAACLTLSCVLLPTTLGFLAAIVADGVLASWTHRENLREGDHAARAGTAGRRQKDPCERRRHHAVRR